MLTDEITAAEVTFADVLHIYTGPTEERRGRPFRPYESYKVDHVDGDTVTLMSLSHGKDFWLTLTIAQIQALINLTKATLYSIDNSSFAPRGECSYCDRQRESESTFFPSHNASSRCRSGGHNHCTCSTCF